MCVREFSIARNFGRPSGQAPRERIWIGPLTLRSNVADVLTGLRVTCASLLPDPFPTDGRS